MVGSRKGSDIRVKRLIAILLLAVMLAASVAVIAGCGGGSSNSSQALSEPEQAVDTMLREMTNGNYQPYLDMIPAELRDQYAQELQQQGTPYTNAKIDEVHYKTDETDADHVTVYFWGVLEMPDGSQQTITEDQAQPIQLMKQDGQWVFDTSAASANSQAQSQTTSP
jgi:hypothetical protein